MASQRLLPCASCAVKGGSRPPGHSGAAACPSREARGDCSLPAELLGLSRCSLGARPLLPRGASQPVAPAALSCWPSLVPRVAFCTWLISNMLFSTPALVYGGYALLLTGAFLIFSLLSFSTVRTSPLCPIQFGPVALHTAYGGSFWLTLAVGKDTPRHVRAQRPAPLGGRQCQCFTPRCGGERVGSTAQLSPCLCLGRAVFGRGVERTGRRSSSSPSRGWGRDLQSLRHSGARRWVGVICLSVKMLSWAAEATPERRKASPVGAGTVPWPPEKGCGVGTVLLFPGMPSASLSPARPALLAGWGHRCPAAPLQLGPAENLL